MKADEYLGKSRKHNVSTGEANPQKYRTKQKQSSETVDPTV